MPKKSRGKHSILTSEEIEEIITWVCLGKSNRRLLWYQIPVAMGLNVSYYCVGNALRRAGFSRRVARRKPLLLSVIDSLVLGRNLGGFSIGSSIPMVPTQWDATLGERAYQDMVPISSPVTLVH
jgi:hypothetical protein